MRRSRQRPLRALLATAIASVTALAACNAILGNEERELDGNLLGSKPDASNTPDVSVVPPSSDAGASCDADVARDPRNCGACGHDCLQGACANGSCQPFLLASGQVGPGNLVTEDGGLYWTNNDGTVNGCTAGSCTTTTKMLTKLTAANPVLTGLAVQGAQLYFVGYYTDSAYSCPVTGCASPQKIAGNIRQPVLDRHRRAERVLRVCLPGVRRSVSASVLRRRRGARRGRRQARVVRHRRR